MELLEPSTWGEFQDVLRNLQEVLEEASEGRKRDLRGGWIFRGQSDHSWSLKTTLERHDASLTDCLEYYRTAYRAKHHVEALTNRHIKTPTVDEYRMLLSTGDEPYPFDDYPAYSYLAYLRHHGFPSPLLDWTESPYVAAFFAFRNAHPSSERVAIFAFAEYFAGMKMMATGEPVIQGRGPYVTTDPRHVLQQCCYTTCAARLNGRWNYVSHEAIFGESDPTKEGQDVLYKITLPASLKDEVMDELDRYNINAHTLFGSEDALIETVVRRHWSRKEK